MPSPSDSPPPLQQEQTHESDVVCEGSLSLNQETPNQPDPPTKSDPETLPPPQFILDPEDNGPEEEEGQEQEIPEISSGMPLHVAPPIADTLLSVPEVTLTSPSNDPNTQRGTNKRKKGKGKVKGKPNIKKQQAIEEKLQILMEKLNPVPFMPHKILDFAKHEKVLKKLGLWDFVHIDFDRDMRADLIAQLVATYEAKSRGSYVNGFRILVNRTDLGRPFKLPVKKEKGIVGGVEVDLDWEALSEDSIGFIGELVSDWLLLHEDMWMMPDDMINWLKVIKDGHPEKVDWAGLFWFMVEKELTQGSKLRDCYYASHLQHLIKHQREEVFLREKATAEAVELDAEAKEEDNEGDVKVGDAIDGPVEEGCWMGGPSTELTLGQDVEKEEEMKEVEMMDVEKCSENDEEGGGEEQGRLLLHGKNNLGEHFMQRSMQKLMGYLAALKMGKS